MSKEAKHSIYSKMRGNLVRGLAVLFPFYLTIIMVRFLIRSISKPLIRPLRWFSRMINLDVDANQTLENALIVGLSLLITLALILSVGMLAQRVFGRKIMKFFELTFEKLPLVNTFYRTFREFTRILTGETGDAYKKVVLVAIPGSTTGKTLGFVTGSMKLDDNLSYLIVFVPTAPNISTGFLLFLPQNEVIETTLTSEDAFKMIISLGIINRGMGEASVPLEKKLEK